MIPHPDGMLTGIYFLTKWRKTVLIGAFLGCLTLNQVACAEGPAGIVLYARTGDDIMLLLADHAEGSGKNRGWASFGGGAHANESAAETAARETEEETRGYFSQEMLLEKLGDQRPIMDGAFACFIVEIDHVDPAVITAHRPPSEAEGFYERGPYAWVPVTVMSSYIEQDIDEERRYPIPEKYLPRDRLTDWLWPKGLNNLRQAVLLDALPWSDPVTP